MRRRCCVGDTCVTCVARRWRGYIRATYCVLHWDDVLCYCRRSQYDTDLYMRNNECIKLATGICVWMESSSIVILF